MIDEEIVILIVNRQVFVLKLTKIKEDKNV